MNDLCAMTLEESIHALRTGRVSSTELTRAYLEQITSLEPEIHAFISLTPELALQQAQEADRRWSDWRKAPSQPPPLLLGLPLVVKDVLCVADVPCTCGSRILENFRPPYHATAVQRLLDAGMVLLGKTNTDEFAMGSSTENSAYGVTHNPWDVQRVPGGSSGGSAAAVSAHMAPLALGTDTGGSVRQPAAYCGVTGIKPTYGRVSRYGLVAFGSSLDVVGVFGREARDVARALVLISGQDPRDATSSALPPPQVDFDHSPTQALHGLKVGIPEEYFSAGLQPEVRQAVEQAISQLQDLGAQLQTVHLPHTSYALPVYYLIAPAEASANLARYDGVRFGQRAESETIAELFFRTRGRYFGAEVKRRIMLGTYALSAGYYQAYYGQAQKVRTLIREDFARAFTALDILAAPVTPTTAFPIGEHADDPLAMYMEDALTLPANLAGIPALAFPVGFDAKGLPIGMQIMASHFNEPLLFRVAHAYQQVTDWHTRLPAILSRG